MNVYHRMFIPTDIMILMDMCIYVFSFTYEAYLIFWGHVMHFHIFYSHMCAHNTSTHSHTYTHSHTHTHTTHTLIHTYLLHALAIVRKQITPPTGVQLCYNLFGTPENTEYGITE